VKDPSVLEDAIRDAEEGRQPPIAKAGIVGAVAAVGYELVAEIAGDWLEQILAGLGERMRAAH
jgi:hypothetical protein